MEETTDEKLERIISELKMLQFRMERTERLTGTRPERFYRNSYVPEKTTITKVPIWR